MKKILKIEKLKKGHHFRPFFAAKTVPFFQDGTIFNLFWENGALRALFWKMVPFWWGHFAIRELIQQYINSGVETPYKEL